MNDICQHGGLRRKCPTCHADEDVAELRAEVERLRAALTEILDMDLFKCLPECDSDFHAELCQYANAELCMKRIANIALNDGSLRE